MGKWNQVQTGTARRLSTTLRYPITGTYASRPTRQKPKGVTSLACSQHAALLISAITTIADRSGQVIVHRVSKNRTWFFTVEEEIPSVKCAVVDNQILVKANEEKGLISSADSIDLWELTSAPMVEGYTCSNSGFPRRWAIYLENEDIICFDGTSCRPCT